MCFLDLPTDQDGQRTQWRRWARGVFGPERLIVEFRVRLGWRTRWRWSPKTARLMAQRGVTALVIHQVVYANALAVYGLNGEMDETALASPADYRPEDVV